MVLNINSMVLNMKVVLSRVSGTAEAIVHKCKIDIAIVSEIGRSVFLIISQIC